MAIINAVASGNYSDTATWTGGVIPGSGDIASSGGFRITLDVDPEAQLSACNTDWVAAGGTTLSTAHTGGFDVPNGATRNIPAGMRYGFYRAASTASNRQSLYITNGTVTIGDLIYVEGNTATSRDVYLMPTGTLSLTVGDIYTHNIIINSYVVELNAGMTANVTMSIGEIKPVTGDRALSGGFITTASTPNTFHLTVRKTPWANSDYKPLSVIFATPPISGSSVTFLETVTAKGTGTKYIGLIQNVGTVTIPGIDLSAGNISGVEALIFNLLSTSLIINGNIITNGKSGIAVSSAGTVTVNGNLVRTSGSTNDSASVIWALGQTGAITINGDIIENGVNRTTTYYPGASGVVRLRNCNLTCNNIIGIGKCAMGVSLDVSSAGNTLTVLGNVDARGAVVVNNSFAGVPLYLENNVSALNIHIHGNVYGAASTKSTAVADGTTAGFAAIRVESASNLGSFIVDGRIVAGDYSPAIVVASSTLVCDVQANIVEGGNQVFTSGQSCPAIVLPTQRVVVSEIICGLSGKYPVNGRVVFRDSVNGVFRARNQSGTELVFVQQALTVLPVAADIRYGTTVGGIVGTCHVPDAQEVLFNVPVDNTVGSLVPTVTTVDTSSLTVALAEIKAKTDQLAFTSHGVVADTVDPNVVTDISVAVTDGNWDAQSTWEDGNIPLITSFVFTNGNEVIVNGTVECAGVADTSEAGGLIVDAGGNVALKSAYGDELYSSVYYLANLDGNINNLSYGAGSATFGSGAVPTYSTAESMGVSQSLFYGGSTSASVNVSVPALASGEELTIEYWVKHNTNAKDFYFGHINGSSTPFSRSNTSVMFSRVVQPSEYASDVTGFPIILNQWYHIALVRKSDNTWSWYENGNRLAVVAGLSSIPAKVWGLFTDNPYNGSGRHVNGWVTHPRITLGVSRYTGVTYAIPYAPFPQYAPAPGSTISGRVVLGTNGAVIQAGNNPNSVRTGILQSIAAKLMYGNDAILNSIGSVVAPDNTARFDALDNVASGIKAQTDLLTFSANGVVTDAGSATDYTDDLQQIKNLVVAGLK